MATERVLVRGVGGVFPRGNIAKGVPPTFGALQAAQELGPWLDDAMASLGQVINAALAGDPLDPTVTTELRLQAVRTSVGEFGDQLLERVAAAVVGPAASPPASAAATTPATDVAKRRGSPFRGVM